MSTAKIDELEMKLAFLEDTLEKLSDEFYDNSYQNHAVIDEKPPHY